MTTVYQVFILSEEYIWLGMMHFSFLKVLEEEDVNKLMGGEKGKYFSKFRHFLRGGADYVKWVVILELILLNPIFT